MLKKAIDAVRQAVAPIVDRATGKVPPGTKRNGHWPTVRKQHLEANPNCAVCGASKGKIEVHHIQEFSRHPDLELDPTNLITLCENGANGLNCHLAVGHLGNFKSFNANVVADAKTVADKIKNRP